MPTGVALTTRSASADLVGQPADGAVGTAEHGDALGADLRERQLHGPAHATGTQQQRVAHAVGAEPLDGLDGGRQVGVVADEPAAVAHDRVDRIGLAERHR